jgi:hypothetical protein
MLDWEDRTEALDEAANAPLLQLLKQRRRARDFSLMAGGLGDQIDKAGLLRRAAELGFVLATEE